MKLSSLSDVRFGAVFNNNRTYAVLFVDACFPKTVLPTEQLFFVEIRLLQSELRMHRVLTRRGEDGAHNSFNFLNIPSINKLLFKQHEIERTGWDKKINFDTLTDSKTTLYQRNYFLIWISHLLQLLTLPPSPFFPSPPSCLPSNTSRFLPHSLSH